MGNDAYVCIKKRYSKSAIEKILILIGYEKEEILFIVGMMMNISFLQGCMFG